MKRKSIAKIYSEKGATSRKVRFEAIAVMEPSISGIRRSLAIPPYARKSSAMIKAYVYQLKDAHQLSAGSKGLK